MRSFLTVLALVTLTGCSQEELIQKFSSPEDQATAKSYIDHLRARNFDEIEKALDPGIRTADILRQIGKDGRYSPESRADICKDRGSA